MFVILDDEELVGFSSFSFSYSTILAAGPIVHVEDFYVKKTHKGKWCGVIKSGLLLQLLLLHVMHRFGH